MKSLRHLTVLLFAAKVGAEAEELAGSVIVELHKFAVGAQGVKKVFHDFQEKVNSRHDTVFLFEFVKPCVSKQQKILSGYLNVILRGAGLIILVADVGNKFFLANFFDEVGEYRLGFGSEVVEHLLQGVDVVVLAEISELTNVFLEVKG